MKTDTPNWNEIIFEKRNKLYGAYELRTNYSSRLFKSFIITLSGSGLLFILLYSSNSKTVEDLLVTTSDSVIFSNIIPIETVRERKAQPFVNRPAVTSTKPDESSYVPVNDSLPEEADVPHSSNDGIPAVKGDSPDGSADPSLSPLPGEDAGPDETYSSSSVDSLPEFPGGLDKFYDFLTKRIHFTEEASRARLNKKTYVSFNVNEHGFISDIVILSAVGYGIDEQVVDVLINSPKWSPGIVRNTPVKTKMIMPLSFRLAQ